MKNKEYKNIGKLKGMMEKPEKCKNILLNLAFVSHYREKTQPELQNFLIDEIKKLFENFSEDFYPSLERIFDNVQEKYWGSAIIALNSFINDVEYEEISEVVDFFKDEKLVFPDKDYYLFSYNENVNKIYGDGKEGCIWEYFSEEELFDGDKEENEAYINIETAIHNLFVSQMMFLSFVLGMYLKENREISDKLFKTTVIVCSAFTDLILMRDSGSIESAYPNYLLGTGREIETRYRFFEESWKNADINQELPLAFFISDYFKEAILGSFENQKKSALEPLLEELIFGLTGNPNEGHFLLTRELGEKIALFTKAVLAMQSKNIFNEMLWKYYQAGIDFTQIDVKKFLEKYLEILDDPLVSVFELRFSSIRGRVFKRLLESLK